LREIHPRRKGPLFLCPNIGAITGILLTNVYIRMHKKRSSSRVVKATTRRYKRTDLISQKYKKLGKNRSTSRDKAIQEVEEQVTEDRFGDVPK
jgi:hypothetical protein